jgi:hypothetical protein
MKSIDQTENTIAEDVAKFGFHVVQVDGVNEAENYSYTVGLFHNFDHPELVIKGLSPNKAFILLSYFVRQIRAGRDCSTQKGYENLIANCIIKFNEPSGKENYSNYLEAANDFYDSIQFPVYNIAIMSKSQNKKAQLLNSWNRDNLAQTRKVG